MILNIQLFGGRGAISGIPKNKRKSIKSYEKRIKEHKDKIKSAKKVKKVIIYKQFTTGKQK
jgi:ABC-type Fe2+-enterobactin transport system substrate-binding protein